MAENLKSMKKVWKTDYATITTKFIQNTSQNIK